MNNRRNWLKKIGAGLAGATAAVVTKSESLASDIKSNIGVPVDITKKDTTREILSATNKYGEKFIVIEDETGAINIGMEGKSKVKFTSDTHKQILEAEEARRRKEEIQKNNDSGKVLYVDADNNLSWRLESYTPCTLSEGDIVIS